jgi:anti-anti-sigma factor
VDDVLLRCHFAVDGESDILHVTGELDIATAPTLERALADHLDGQGGDFRLDLHSLTFVDSSGAKALMHAHNRVESLGRRLVIVRPTRAVRKVLDLMGFDQVLAIEDDHG